jgi:cyclic pyranopterin phosphate synthase
MPLIVEDLRTLHPHLDLSIITAGAVPPERLAACLDAGLSRANLSIHGWRIEAFRKNGGTVGKLAQRNGCLALLLGRGLPLKLNYVYGGPDCLADLAALLDFAADKPVVVNVLDDLQDSSAGSATVLEAVARLRGQPSERWTEPDPHSLPTLRLRWADGLLVEIKDTRLGDVAPWKACSTCPVRNQCREGIHALRLTHTGNLQPCMDRPELGRALAEVTGVPALAHEMNAWLREVA